MTFRKQVKCAFIVQLIKRKQIADKKNCLKVRKISEIDVGVQKCPLRI